MAYLTQFTFSRVLVLFLCKVSFVFIFTVFSDMSDQETPSKKPSDRERRQKLAVSSIKIEVRNNICSSLADIILK